MLNSHCNNNNEKKKTSKKKKKMWLPGRDPTCLSLEGYLGSTTTPRSQMPFFDKIVVYVTSCK